ncbi:MAG: Cys-tRNA(Pro) deacylase [Clostridiales bacterium]|nr:Cys-tRNA(Pro) deacylase [Clostridiales bacterium]
MAEYNSGKAPNLKTNVMRILEKENIKYIPHEYPHGKDAVDGASVAKLMNQDPEYVFKTLVTKGASGKFYVFVVPVADELDLKKCAASVGEKSVAMIHVKDITRVTGYVRGGCSPIGMKKQYKTTFHKTAEEIPKIIVSTGKIGYQIDLQPKDLIRLTDAQCADIIK